MNRPDGRLVYDAANIANHFYTLDFLKNVCSREFEDQLEYHIAHKKIKHVDPTSGTVSYMVLFTCSCYIQ
jgi:UDP-N-acetylglucosamine/UDP-N-acetylgalactosamine diphosphorylase